MSNLTVEEYRSVKAAVIAGMETGDIDRSRTVLTEFAELYPEQAQSLSLDVIGAYGIVLL